MKFIIKQIKIKNIPRNFFPFLGTKKEMVLLKNKLLLNFNKYLPLRLLQPKKTSNQHLKIQKF